MLFQMVIYFGDPKEWYEKLTPWNLYLLMHLSQTCIMSTMCKLVFFLLYIIYGYCWGTLVIQITLLKGYVLQSTSPLQGRNGLLCNHNSFKNQWLLFPHRFSLHWDLRDSCIILNVSKRNENSRIINALKVIIQFLAQLT